MLSSALKARDRTFRGAHANSDCFLCKSCARTRGQHFVRKRILDLKGSIGCAETTAFRCLFKKNLMGTSNNSNVGWVERSETRRTI